MSYIHLYSIIQNIFTSLKIPSALSMHPSLFNKPLITMAFSTVFIVLPFRNAIWLESYNMKTFRLNSFIQQYAFRFSPCIFFFFFFLWLDSSFLFIVTIAQIAYQFIYWRASLQVWGIFNKVSIDICVEVSLWSCIQLIEWVHIKDSDCWIIW